MTQITTTETADFEKFTVRLTRTAGQDELQLELGDVAGAAQVQIAPGDLRTLAGWLNAQVAALPKRAWSELRTGPGDCGDERASHGEALAPDRCTLQPGHTGNHWGGLYNWTPLQRVDEVPMGGRCGNVRYWRPINASKLDDDLRSVCTLPIGHQATLHEGPDQTGKTWQWNAGAECNATKGGNWCTLSCGHKGGHQQEGTTWQNRLQVD